MNWTFIWLFTGLTILNVVIQTIKSIATIKCGKTIAALINAIAYGLYTFVIFYTNSDGMSLWLKALVTALANLVGVWLVKYFEEKGRKDKLWKVESTIPAENFSAVKYRLELEEVPFSYIDIDKYYIFNIYCETQEDSLAVKSILNDYNAKYFVSESKIL